MITRTMLVTLHDVLTASRGDALICELDDGSEGLLRKVGQPVDPASMAESHARREGLPIVELSHDELIRLAHGDIALIWTGDQQLYVRIMTVDELMELHERGCRKFNLEPTLTRERAAELVAHL